MPTPYQCPDCGQSAVKHTTHEDGYSLQCLNDSCSAYSDFEPGTDVADWLGRGGRDVEDNWSQAQWFATPAA